MQIVGFTGLGGLWALEWEGGLWALEWAGGLWALGWACKFIFG